jgi:transposase-like protein
MATPPCTFTSEQETEIVTRYQSGETIKEIATSVGTGRRPVVRLLQLREVYDPDRPSVPSRYSDAQKREMAEQYAAGAGLKAVADAFGCTDGHVLRILHARGVQMRPARRPVARSRFTPEQESEMAERYADGATCAALAREHGCSVNPIRRVLIEQGVYEGPRFRRGAGYTRAQKRQMAERYEAGASIAAIAKEFGSNGNTVWKILTHSGVEMRDNAWRGGRVKATGGYIAVAADRDDPLAVAMANVTGYVLEHRLVMAHSLGRPLTRSETVHHVNGRRTDNRPENLQLRQGRHGKGVRTVCLDCGSSNVGHVDI